MRLASLLLALSPNILIAEPITVSVWADNWFSMSVDGTPALEDSVPITTERSFNAETATIDMDLPAQIAFTVKDFKENDTGLEYIGSRRQQMGDGGFVAQFTNANGVVVGVTDDQVRCMVLHHAPVDVSCAKSRDPQVGQGACASETHDAPAGWDRADFDDRTWPKATEYSARAVRPKDGYDRIRWDRKAELIWGPSLEQDNTLICRMTLG